jgi:general stress protein 26
METTASRASGLETSQVVVRRIFRELRRQHFVVLSTVDENGRPSSAGVSYGVSPPDEDLTLYVMTRSHLQKARNIVQNPSVSLVIPVRRWLLWFLPPPTIQLRGRAEILDGTDEEGVAIFQRFWLGREILDAYHASSLRGETRICFLKITPDPLVRSYMVGSNVWSLMGHMEDGAAKVVIPPNQQV